MKGPAPDVIKTHIIMSNRKKQGFRWNAINKALALSLYHTSPKCYPLLRKLFRLPSSTTLRRSIKDLHIYPGYNDLVYAALKKKAETMSPDEKMCVVLFDKMATKEGLSYDPARDYVEGYENLRILGHTKYLSNHAMVVMARGITAKWKQPIAYFMTSGPMTASAMKDVLLQAIDTIDKPSATVSTQ